MDAENTRVNELAFSTPLCAVLQISLVRLLDSWGIRPTGITSHSSGEVAAAYAAGALTLRSAMAIVFARGQVAGRKIPGVVEVRPESRQSQRNGYYERDFTTRVGKEKLATDGTRSTSLTAGYQQNKNPFYSEDSEGSYYFLLFSQGDLIDQ